MKKRKWSDYLWVVELLYLCLGLFNILFAWLGMLFFTIPLLVAVFGGSKAYCNRYCGRGQLLSILGEKLKLSRNAPPPKFLRSRWFRYGFLVFFMVMFGRMLLATYQVFAGAPLSQTVTLLWTFRLPWQWRTSAGSALGRTVCIWFFWRHAHFHRAGDRHNGVVSSQILVRLLPDGNHDTRNLHTKKQKEGKTPWKNKPKRLRSF